MVKMNPHGTAHSHHIPYLAVILSSIFSLYIIRPYLLSLLAGLIVAYSVYPLYRFARERVRSETFSALIVTIFLILIILVPCIFIVGRFTNQAKTFYTYVVEKAKTGEFMDVKECTSDSESMKCRLSSLYREILKNPVLSRYLDDFIMSGASYIINFTPRMILAIPRIAINTAVILLVIFFSLRDGERLVNRIVGIFPLAAEQSRRVLKKIDDTIFAVVYGHLLAALAQAVAATVGFYLFGIPSPLIFGTLTLIGSLIPFVGAPVVWFPISFIMIAAGIVDSATSVLARGILLFIYCFLVVSTIDNVIRVMIVSGRAKINPLLVFLGVLGGISVFGVIGIVLGPLILNVTHTVFCICEEELRKAK